MAGGILSGFAGNISNTEATLQGRRSLDLDEKQFDLQKKRDAVTKQQNRFKNRISQIMFLDDTIGDRNLPESFRIEAATERARLSGIAITFTDIAQIDAIEKISQKSSNVTRRIEKGEISRERGEEIIRGLDTELRLKLSNIDAFKAPVKSFEETKNRDIENNVFRFNQIIDKAAQGQQVTTEEASFIAQIKKSNSPQNVAIRRLAFEKQQERKFELREDELGNLVRIDKSIGERFPVQGIPGTTQATQRPDPFITARETTLASGPVSKLKRAFAAILGPFIPGEQATGTKSAVNKINNLNKQLVQTLVLSKRFPVFEQAQIKDFLIDPGKTLSDPGGDAGKLIDLKSFLIRKKQDLQNQLNQTISAEQRKGNIGKIGNIDIAINLLPPEIALKAVAQREITIEEIRNTSVEEIRSMAEETLDLFTDEQVTEMLRKIDEADAQSGTNVENKPNVTSGSF